MATLAGDPVHRIMCEVADAAMRESMPGGVAHKEQEFTSIAFDYYIAKHGLPKTANEARQMFEFAAMLDMAAEMILGRR